MFEISTDLLLDCLFDGVYFVDRERRIRYWNQAAERLTGYLKNDVVGSRCADNILRHVDENGTELCNHGCPFAATLEDGKMREVSVLAHHKQGYRVPVLVRTSPVRNEHGEIIGAVEVFTDNTNAVQMFEELTKLKHDVYQDPLTRVGNRRYGEMSVESALFKWKAHRIPFGVLFLDVDRFKQVNDRYGHQIGDDVLVMVAQSISHVLRKVDVVSRWGGEEFLAVFPGANRDTLASLAERIRVMVERSFLMLGDEKLEVTISVGGAIADSDDTAKSIVDKADHQMYQSKQGGRNRISIH